MSQGSSYRWVAVVAVMMRVWPDDGGILALFMHGLAQVQVSIISTAGIFCLATLTSCTTANFATGRAFPVVFV